MENNTNYYYCKLIIHKKSAKWHAKLLKLNLYFEKYLQKWTFWKLKGFFFFTLQVMHKLELKVT